MEMENQELKVILSYISSSSPAYVYKNLSLLSLTFLPRQVQIIRAPFKTVENLCGGII